jgi:polygalacturonase
VCIRDTKNPIYMDTHYTASAKTSGDLVPVFRDIRLSDVRVMGGGKVTLDGYDASRRLGMSFDNVVFDTPAAITVAASHVDAHVGPGALNLSLSGEDVTVSGASGASNASAPNGCAGKFVPFPSR